MVDLLGAVEENIFFWGQELLLGFGGAWLVSRLAHRCGLVDTPSARSSHVRPTPKGGGVGILVAFVFGCIAFGLSLVFCLSVTFLSLLGFVGDRINLPVSVRLVLQFVIVLIVVFYLADSPLCLFGESVVAHGLGMLLLGGGLASVFIVGTANFYNFMDGIDGIAAAAGIVCFCLLAAYTGSCWGYGSYFLVSIGMAMACLGFLPLNVPNAKVFMGDVGSILLGVVFGVMVLVSAKNVIDFIVITSFLFPFYADEVLTMVERISRRESLVTPHRCHLYQVLANEAGCAHWRVSFGYGAAQLLLGLVTWAASLYGLEVLLAWLGLAAVLVGTLNYKVKKRYFVGY